MLANFELKLTSQMRADIAARDMTIHQILTLASIIEKEVSKDADRKIVADVFYKRLAAGMALQADSTVNYFTGKGLARASADAITIAAAIGGLRLVRLPIRVYRLSRLQFIRRQLRTGFF